MDLDDRATQERMFREILETAPMATCPAIKHSRRLPPGLERWIALDRFFDQGWFFGLTRVWLAWLPTGGYGAVEPFTEGATRVLMRLGLSTGPAFLAGSSSKPMTLPTETYGHIEFRAYVALNRPDAEIVEEFRRFLALARRRLKYELQHQRPVVRAVFQRDFVVYALHREGWDLPSITLQLEYMNLAPFPKHSDPKGYLRKVKARFRRLAQEVAEPFLQAQQSAHEALIRCMFGDETIVFSDQRSGAQPNRHQSGT